MIELVFNILSLVTAVIGLGFLTWYPLYCRKRNGGEFTKSYSNTHWLFYKKLDADHYWWGVYIMITGLAFIIPAYHFSFGWLQSALAIGAVIFINGVGLFPSGFTHKMVQMHKDSVKLFVGCVAVWAALQSLWLIAISTIIPFSIYFMMKKKIPEGLLGTWAGFMTIFSFLTGLSILHLIT